MVKRSVTAAFLICGVLGGGTAVAAQDNPRQSQWSVIEDYCIGCHNNQVRAGGKAFDLMSPGPDRP